MALSHRAPPAVRSLADLDAIGVGELESASPKRVEALGLMGIRTVLDLVTHYPRRYIDRTNQVPISEVVDGEDAMVVATVRKVSVRSTRNRRSMVEVDLSDGATYLHLTFFNQPWRAKQLRDGMEVVVFGRVERFRGGGR